MATHSPFVAHLLLARSLMQIINAHKCSNTPRRCKISSAVCCEYGDLSVLLNSVPKHCMLIESGNKDNTIFGTELFCPFVAFLPPPPPFLTLSMTHPVQEEKQGEKGGTKKEGNG